MSIDMQFPDTEVTLKRHLKYFLLHISSDCKSKYARVVFYKTKHLNFGYSNTGIHIIGEMQKLQ